MKEIQRLLRSALPPVVNTEPRRDLWPEMLNRIAAGPAIRFGVLDWAIAGLVSSSVIAFPRLIPALFYHL
jgi:hypothetical protein